MAEAGPRPGPTQTRERILVAARTLFGQRGYDGTMVRAIAADSGINPALLQHFFGSTNRVPDEPISAYLSGPTPLRALRRRGVFHPVRYQLRRT